MAAGKSDINVLKLLQQLEELKQKKARNVKKLKRKLGRAVILKPNSNIEGSKCDPDRSENKSFSFKSGTSEVRSVLGEWNCKDSILSEFQLIENDSCLRGTEKHTTNHTNACFDLPSPKPKQAVSTQVCAISFMDQGSEIVTDVSFDEVAKDIKPHDQKLCRKRSAPEFLSEEQYVNHSLANKKTKIFNECISSKPFSNTGPFSIEEQERSFPDVSQKNCDVVGQTLKDFNDNQNEKVEFAHNNSSCFLPSNLLEMRKEARLNVQSLPLCKDLVNQRLGFSQDLVEDCHTNTSDKNYITKSCTLNNLENPVQLVQYEIPQTATVPNLPDTDKLKHLVTVEETCILGDTAHVDITDEKVKSIHAVVVVDSADILPLKNQDSTVANELSKPDFEDDFDYTITEVAETVAIFLAKSTPEAISTEIDNSQPEVANYEEVCTAPPEVDDTEDLMRNFQPVISNFEEVCAFNSQLELTDTVLRPEDDCTNNADLEDAGCENVNTEVDGPEFDDSSDVCSDDGYSGHILKTNNNKNTLNFELKQQTLLLEEVCCKSKHDKNVEEPCDVPKSDVLIVPETDNFDFVGYDVSELQVDNVASNVCITTDNNEIECKNIFKNKCNSKISKESSNTYLHSNCILENNLNNEFENNSPQSSCLEISDKKVDTSTDEIMCNQLFSETEFDTDSLKTEDFLKLVNCQQIPFESDNEKINLTEDDACDHQISSLKFTCCLQSGIGEIVSKLKLVFFNNSQYLFIQHLTWIQVWRQEKDDWIKIFSHQVDDTLQLQELCLSNNENFLVLVMLLSSEQNSHCLQFLVFEKESRLIKLMEHTHWFENSSEVQESFFLCGLDDLRFASAQGQDTFKVYSHNFSCLDGNPRLLTVTLGTTTDCLHSLCKINKLPNALLGMSDSMLYVWHLLEARLVTSVHLQVVDSLIIENCIWATVENGLVFLMVTCANTEGPEICQLLTANLATGFCQITLNYTLQPAQEIKLPSDRKMSLVYIEPLIGAITKDGAFIWSVEDEYCCASLKETNFSSIAIVPSLKDSYLIVVGCDGGCVNCYELKCS